MRRPRAASKRSAIVGSASVSTWLSMIRALLRFSICISALSTWATRSGVAVSVGSQPQRSQKISGGGQTRRRPCPAPRRRRPQTNVCRAGGNHRLPGGVGLERESLAAICLGQHIVKALRQLVERLSGGGELACLRVQNTRLADASADKSRACLAGAAGNMRGPRLPRRGVQATARPVPWHAGDGKHVRGGAEEHAAAAAHELETQHLQQRRLAAAADNRGNARLDLERGGKVSARRFHLFTAV